MADLPVVAVITAKAGSEQQALTVAGDHLAQAPAIHPLSPVADR
jgi:hypothetical protein